MCEPERKKNILRQQFSAERPNQRWISDVTCFKLGDHYFYICMITDLFSRRVIKYKISKKNNTQLITTTFKMAHKERSPPHPASSFIATVGRNIPLIVSSSSYMSTMRSNPFFNPANRMTMQ